MSEETITTTPTVILKSSSGLTNDKREDGCELIEDIPIEGNPELELVEILEEGESFAKGDVILERIRSKIKNYAGQQHLERLLVQKVTIPKEWRPYYLIAPGTKWRNPHDSIFVPCLCWRRNEWYLEWIWIGHRWNSKGRFVRCK